MDRQYEDQPASSASTKELMEQVLHLRDAHIVSFTVLTAAIARQADAKIFSADLKALFDGAIASLHPKAATLATAFSKGMIGAAEGASQIQEELLAARKSAH